MVEGSVAWEENLFTTHVTQSARHVHGLATALSQRTYSHKQVNGKVIEGQTKPLRKPGKSLLQ